MKIPGFTAEASLAEVKDRYVLALAHAGKMGIVLPQCYHYECFYDSQGVIVCRCFPVQQ
jgi:hypothetical protein